MTMIEDRSTVFQRWRELSMKQFFRRLWLDLRRPLRTCCRCQRRSRMGVLYSARVDPIFKGADGKWRCKYECRGDGRRSTR